MERNSTPLAAQEVEEEEDETVNNSRRTCELELPVLLKGMLLNCCFHHHTLLRFQLSVLHTLQVHPEGKAILSAVIAASGSIPKHSFVCVFFLSHASIHVTLHGQSCNEMQEGCCFFSFCWSHNSSTAAPSFIMRRHILGDEIR
jgi:hypothetical protein